MNVHSVNAVITYQCSMTLLLETDLYLVNKDMVAFLDLNITFKRPWSMFTYAH